MCFWRNKVPQQVFAMISAELDSVNPICNLSSLERSRICTLVFKFNGPYRTRPTTLHNFGCARNLITFSTEDGKNAAHDDQYFEWMIPCYESVPEYAIFLAYYLSYRKDNTSSSNYVFTYFRSTNSESIFLMKAYNDVRIDDILSQK